MLRQRQHPEVVALSKCMRILEAVPRATQLRIADYLCAFAREDKPSEVQPLTAEEKGKKEGELF